MIKDIRPGDVWEEADGDVCFIIDMDEDQDYWLALAYYPATCADPRYDDPNLAYRQDWELRTLLHRQEEEPLNKSTDGWQTLDSGKRDVTASGYQRDTQEGKPRFALMFPKGIPYKQQMITRFAALLGRGIEKYGYRNWEKADIPEDLDRFQESALRHLIQWMTGEVDEDHAAAVLFNVMAHETIKLKLAQDKDA